MKAIAATLLSIAPQASRNLPRNDLLLASNMMKL
jgi:hypothetical protein